MGWGSGVAVSCGMGLRHGSDPALLSLWCRPAAVAPIRPLAWEFPYATGMALKRNIYIYIFKNNPFIFQNEDTLLDSDDNYRIVVP